MEFDIINHYFHSRAQNRKDVILGIGDDCALLKPPINHTLAMSTDTLVAGVHYDPKADPSAIGHKSLAVSLSDLAAMGAEPAWAMLSLNLDNIDEKWMTSFSDGFFALLNRYDVSLIGGNISSGFPTITTQVTGFLPEKKGLRRSGAKPGDKIYVTGNLGDAALALFLQTIECSSAMGEILPILQKALDFPEPRIKEGLILRDIANSAIDISDGLAQDLGHILKQSHVGASINIEGLPLSSAALQVMQLSGMSFEKIAKIALSGGDDYELCFTVSPQHISKLEQAFQNLNCTCIGTIEAKPGLRLIYKDQPYHIEKKGYQHFFKKGSLHG